MARAASESVPHAPDVPFEKYEACGNDFLLIDVRDVGGRALAGELAVARGRGCLRAAVQRWCARRAGVGADGVILVGIDDDSAAPSTADGDRWECVRDKVVAKVWFYNADGSTAALCGNGLRCAAVFALRLARRACGPVRVDWHGSQAFSCFVRDTSAGGPYDVEVDLQTAVCVASFPPAELGAALHGAAWAELVVAGVPHLVVRGRGDLDGVPVRDAGAELARCERVVAALNEWMCADEDARETAVNVTFVETRGDAAAVRTYERGVWDETQACGTGCAAAVAALCRRDELALAGSDFVPVATRGGGVIRVRTVGDTARTGELGRARVFQRAAAARVFAGRVPFPPRQCTDTVFLVRPACFAADPMARSDNAFMAREGSGGGDEGGTVAARALEEFDGVVAALRSAGVRVRVYSGRRTVPCPDEVFPNNWISTYECAPPTDGPARLVVQHAMRHAARRAERRDDVVRDLGGRTVSLVPPRDTDTDTDTDTDAEASAALEGTGSLVLDRAGGVAYASLSPRTTAAGLRAWERAVRGYRVCAFRAVLDGSPVYHTNLVLSIGSSYALACLDAIPSAEERAAVTALLGASGRAVIAITAAQVRACCGNVLELVGSGGARVLACSARAWAALDDRQRTQLGAHVDVVLTPDVSTIERVGGGSVRCMIAEVF